MFQCVSYISSLGTAMKACKIMMFQWFAYTSSLGTAMKAYKSKGAPLLFLYFEPWDWHEKLKKRVVFNDLLKFRASGLT